MPVFLFPLLMGALGGVGLGSILLNATDKPPIINTTPQPVQPPTSSQAVFYGVVIIGVLLTVNKVGLFK